MARKAASLSIAVQFFKALFLVVSDNHIGCREVCPGIGKTRIQLNGLFEQFHRPYHLRLTAVLVKVSAAQEQLPGLQVFRWFAGLCRMFPA